MKTLLVSLVLLLGQQSARPSVGTMSGQLRDVNGVPAAGVRVALTPAVEAGDGVGTLSNLTESDRNGRFRLENVQPGRYLIVAGAPVFLVYFPGVTTRDQGRIVTIAAGQALTNLDFTLGTMSGQVREIFGAPAARVRVAAISVVASVRGATVRNTTETDSEGRFRLEGVLPGSYLIMAGPLDTPNYFPGVSAQDQARTVTIAGGQTITGLEFTISPARVVNDPNGGFALPIDVRVDDGSQLRGLAPVEFQISGNVGVICCRPAVGRGGGGPNQPYRLQSFQPGANTVTVSKVPLGYYVKSLTFGNVDLTQAPLVLNASGAHINVVLTKKAPYGPLNGAKVSGQITNLELPVSRNIGLALIEVTHTGEPVLMGGAINAMDVQAGRKDGVFEIEGVPPGRYKLRIGRTFADATALAVSREIESPGLMFEVGGNEVRNLVLRFEEPATVAKPDTPVPLNPSSITSVSGMVEATNGSIPAFELRFTPTRGSAARSVTISGREFFVRLPEGEYRAIISGLPQGYAVESVSAGPLDLREAFLVTKAGIADRFTGAPISAGITIRLRN